MDQVKLEAIDYDRSQAENPRQAIDADAVERYAVRMQAGDVFPPVLLYQVDSALLVADGLHRIAAAKAADQDTIAAEVVAADERVWKEAILNSNLDHGLVWTRAERREVVAEWLLLYPERADNWIAELARVSKNTVAVVRQELEGNLSIDRLTELVGKDGKTRPRNLAPELIVDPEFEALLPPLTAEEQAGLEALILEHGIMVPLVVWRGKNIVLDGHQRLRLARKHGLQYKVVERDCADRDEARQWIIRNQLTRRTLHPDAASYLRGVLVRETPREKGARPADNSSQNVTSLQEVEQYQRLKASIAEHGVLVPVEYDEDGNVLDGHQRVRACAELGITDWPSIIRSGLSEDEKREHVIALNLERRHMGAEQEKQLVATLRKQGWSDERIEEATGLSGKA